MQISPLPNGDRKQKCTRQCCCCVGCALCCLSLIIVAVIFFVTNASQETLICQNVNTSFLQVGDQVRCVGTTSTPHPFSTCEFCLTSTVYGTTTIRYCVASPDNTWVYDFDEKDAASDELTVVFSCGANSATAAIGPYVVFNSQQHVVLDDSAIVSFEPSADNTSRSVGTLVVNRTYYNTSFPSGTVIFSQNGSLALKTYYSWDGFGDGLWYYSMELPDVSDLYKHANFMNYPVSLGESNVSGGRRLLAEREWSVQLGGWNIPIPQNVEGGINIKPFTTQIWIENIDFRMLDFTAREFKFVIHTRHTTEIEIALKSTGPISSSYEWKGPGSIPINLFRIIPFLPLMNAKLSFEFPISVNVTLDAGLELQINMTKQQESSFGFRCVNGECESIDTSNSEPAKLSTFEDGIVCFGEVDVSLGLPRVTFTPLIVPTINARFFGAIPIIPTIAFNLGVYRHLIFSVQSPGVTCPTTQLQLITALDFTAEIEFAFFMFRLKSRATSKQYNVLTLYDKCLDPEVSGVRPRCLYECNLAKDFTCTRLPENSTAAGLSRTQCQRECKKSYSCDAQTRTCSLVLGGDYSTKPRCYGDCQESTCSRAEYWAAPAGWGATGTCCGPEVSNFCVPGFSMAIPNNGGCCQDGFGYHCSTAEGTWCCGEAYPFCGPGKQCLSGGSCSCQGCAAVDPCMFESGSGCASCGSLYIPGICTGPCQAVPPAGAVRGTPTVRTFPSDLCATKG